MTSVHFSFILFQLLSTFIAPLSPPTSCALRLFQMQLKKKTERSEQLKTHMA